jgi:hypothetical protein
MKGYAVYGAQVGGFPPKSAAARRNREKFGHIFNVEYTLIFQVTTPDITNVGATNVGNVGITNVYKYFPWSKKQAQ